MSRVEGTWFYQYGGTKYGPFKTKRIGSSDLSERFNLPKTYASRFLYSLVDVRFLEGGSMFWGGM